MLVISIEPVDTALFVAEIGGEIIGHIIYSQLEGPIKSLGLGQLSVAPNWRDMQVGTELIRQSLNDLARNGWQSVFLLGAPAYYERFGFKPAQPIK